MYVNPNLLIYHFIPCCTLGNHKFDLQMCESVLFSKKFILSFLLDSSNKLDHIMLVFFCLTSLSMIISRSLIACLMILILGFILILINLVKTPFPKEKALAYSFSSLNAFVSSLTSLLLFKISEIALIQTALKFHVRY